MSKPVLNPAVYDRLDRSMSSAAAFIAMLNYDRPRIAATLRSDVSLEGITRAKRFDKLMNSLNEIVGPRGNLGPPTSMGYSGKLQHLNDYLQLLTPLESSGA